MRSSALVEVGFPPSPEPNFSFSDEFGGEPLPALPPMAPGMAPSPAVAAAIAALAQPPVLSPEEKAALELELTEMLDTYDLAMKKRWDRERLIEECYNLVPQKDWQGGYEDSAELISESLMATCDQAQARLSSLLLSVRPFVRIKGIESLFPEADSTKIAEILENALDRYLRYEVGIEDLIPLILYPTVKFGTSVVDIAWREDLSKVKWTVIQNRDAVVWPAWSTDWQEAEWAGHKTVHTLTSFRKLCTMFGVSPEDQAAIEGHATDKPTETQGETFGDLKDGGIEVEQVSSLKQYGLVDVYVLYGNRVLGEGQTPRKICVLFERSTRKIIAVEENDQISGRHPAHPCRYKIAGVSAWGQGAGHESLNAQANDTMYQNIEADVLKSSCFPVYLIRPGSIADQVWDHPSPGQKIATEDPKADFEKAQLADAAPLEMLGYARQANEQRKMTSTGMSAVLQGQGDPTQKSGSGTGSTMALIAEAGKKFEQIDRNVRNDLAKMCLHTLEVAIQYGQIAPLVKYLSAEDAELLVAAVTASPIQGGSISKSLRISIDAPSANNNTEIRKQQQLVVFKMVVEHAQVMIQGFASQILGATNPAAMIPYILSWEEILASLSQEVLDAHEAVGTKDKVPHAKDFIQQDVQDAQINVLLQTVQQLQAQLQTIVSSVASSPKGGSNGDGSGDSKSSAGLEGGGAVS